MIRQERLTIGGRDFVRTYSDAGRYVVSDETGVEYTEAYDPAELGRTYHEGDVIPVEPDEATVEDYQDALIELGVNLDD
jgi:hypothetical protein